MTDETSKYPWVLASENRIEIMRALDEKQLKPTTIAEKTGIHSSNVSNYLKSLVEQDLVECISPERKKGRIYQLTAEGQEIIDKVEKNRS